MLEWIAGCRLSPIVPPEGKRRQTFASRKLESDSRFERIAFFVDGGRVGFNLGGIAELERAKGHVAGVTGHVTQRAGAEILPAAPDEIVINSCFSRMSRRPGALIGPE